MKAHDNQHVMTLLFETIKRPAQRNELQVLQEMMLDYPLRGGKRLRSQLLLASTQAWGLEGPWKVPLAAAVDMLHNWLLIHDDIQDGSLTRRGQPTLHEKHGMPLALNAGNALHAYMWQVVFKYGNTAVTDLFLETLMRTIEGQQMDVQWVHDSRWDLTEPDYLEMVTLKTAYYTFGLPMSIPLLMVEQTLPDGLAEGACMLGAAFQIRDDVLNLSGNRETYGKDIGDDLVEGKRSLILLHYLSCQATRGEHEAFRYFMELNRHVRSKHPYREHLRVQLVNHSVPYAMHRARQLHQQGMDLLREALQQTHAQDSGALLNPLEDLLYRIQ